MGQRVGDIRMAERVADGQQFGRHHPLTGLGEFACTLGTEEHPWAQLRHRQECGPMQHVTR